MSFASEPGRDDNGLPPVNIEVPDDARELARDVLALSLIHISEPTRH